MPTVTATNDLACFAYLQNEWAGLLPMAMTDTPFQLPYYQRAWWRWLGEGELRLVECRAKNGRLEAVASLFVHEGIVRFVGGTEESDYLDLIATGAAAERGWETTVAALQGVDFPEWTVIDLINIPGGSPTLTILPSLAKACGWRVSQEPADVCPLISLPADFEAYLQMLDKKQRHEVRRKLRRAEEAELRLAEASYGELEPAVERFLKLLTRSNVEKADWLTDNRRGFFHELAEVAAAAGALQLLFAARGDEVGAALFNFSYNGRVWVYNSGIDPTTFGPLSAGVVLTAWAIRQAIERGCAEFDFLRGGEEYKYRFGAQDATVYRLLIERE
jgi:CelD/BcsL family acetyltransferase involved in cellulose biosynthesis